MKKLDRTISDAYMKEEMALSGLEQTMLVLLISGQLRKIRKVVYGLELMA